MDYNFPLESFLVFLPCKLDMKYKIIFSAPAPEDEAMLARALEMSMEPADSKSNKTTGGSSEPNLAAMTEEEQIEYAMRMSMQVEYLTLLSF